MKCESCKFWSPQAIQSTPAERSGKGCCRRYPPQISDRQIEKYFAQGLRGCELGLQATTWPATDGGDGCGEHKAGRGAT